MSKMMSNDEFIAKAAKASPGINIISEYKGKHEFVRCKCNKCLYEWETRASNVLYDGIKCPDCRKKSGKSNAKLTHEEFTERCRTLHPKLRITSKYINSFTKIDCECLVCGNKWSATPADLLHKTKTACPECRKKTAHPNIKKTHEEFLSDLHSITDTIEILSEYQNAKTHVDCRCKICGHKWRSKPLNLLSGYGCKKCGTKRSADKQRCTKENAQKKVHDIFPYIDIVGEYTNHNAPVECLCNKCGITWNPSVANLVKGEGCPHCVESHGERRIRTYLENNSIEYESQKSFGELIGVGGGRLSYDFYIPDCNTLIEYQGIQHEKPVPKFGGEEQFEMQKEHDYRKRKYADENGFSLLEIWYFEDDDIEKILSKTLNINIPVTITA